MYAPASVGRAPMWIARSSVRSWDGSSRKRSEVLFQWTIAICNDLKEWQLIPFGTGRETALLSIVNERRAGKGESAVC